MSMTSVRSQFQVVMNAVMEIKQENGPESGSEEVTSPKPRPALLECPLQWRGQGDPDGQTWRSQVAVRARMSG